ncbi:MAG: hypothetical protein AAFX78_06650 [Cyanobacteria bacterium J06638_20]
MLNYINLAGERVPPENKAAPSDNRSNVVTTVALLITAAVTLAALHFMSTITLEIVDILDRALVSEPNPSLSPQPPEQENTPPEDQENSPPASDEQLSLPGGGGGSNIFLSGKGNFLRADAQISHCGDHFASANFREYAAYAPEAIKGKVIPGEWIELTGSRLYADGILWHQARNHSPLEPSEDGYLTNHQSAKQQFGWIADCFVNRNS